MADLAVLPNWISLDGMTHDLTNVVTEVGSIAALATHWRGIADGLLAIKADAPLGDPVQLAAYLAAHLSDQPVVQAFEALGLAQLHARLAIQPERLGKAAKLLRPMSDFSGGDDATFALSLPALGAAAQSGAGPLALSFDVSLEGGLACEAGAAWPFAADAVADALLRIGGEGRVRTGAGVSLPFGQIGSGSAHADASGALALSVFFRPANAAESYAGALIEALATLPAPLDLQAMSDAAGFAGMILSCEGAVSAGLALSLGKSIDIPQAVSGTIGVTAELSFKRSARWLLSLRKVDEGLRFVLSRDEASERDWSAGVGVQLAAAPLARRVHDLLVAAQDFAGPALSQIKPFFSPGTYIATQSAALLAAAARSIVDLHQLDEALRHDLALAMGGEGDQPQALAQLVGSTIADLASNHAHGLLTDADGWAAAVTAELVTRFPPLAAVPSGDIQARIKPMLGDVSARLDGLLASLVGDPAWSAHLSQELSAIGAAVQAEELQADHLLDATRSTLETFFAFAAKVTEATADDISKKLSARFGWSGSDSSGLKYELIGTFTDTNAETVALWKALVTGRLEPFQQMLAEPARTPAGLVLGPESSLARFAGKQSGFAAEISVLGIDVSIASIVKGEATITRSAAGDITVSAAGSALRKVEGFDEGRSATFISSWDLLMLKSDAHQGIQRTMVIDMGFDHDDKDLKAAEVEALLSGLSEQGLIAPARVQHALAIYQEWRVKGTALGKIQGRIALRLRLPATAAERMVAIGRKLNEHDNTILLAIFDLAVRNQIATGVTSTKQYERDIKQAMETFTISQKPEDPIAYLVALSNSKVQLLPAQADGPRLSALAQLVPRAGALVTLLRTMAQIYDAVPASTEAPRQGTWTEVQYAEAQKHLVGASRSWLRLNQDFVFWFKSALHPAMLAFLRLLVAISSQQLPGAALIPDPRTAIDLNKSNDLFLITMNDTISDEFHAV